MAQKQKTEGDIWDQPMVKAAIKAGRPPSDIAILACPYCGKWSYYNQGSHFTCHECRRGWLCISDGEEPPSDMPFIRLDGFTSLADTLDVHPEPQFLTTINH